MSDICLINNSKIVSNIKKIDYVMAQRRSADVADVQSIDAEIKMETRIESGRR